MLAFHHMAEFNVFRSIGFTLLVLVTLFFTFQALYQLYRQLKRGKPAPERWGDFGERIRSVLVYVFGQRRLLRHPAGLGHFVIFYAFIAINIVAAEVFIRAYFPGFSLSFLGAGYDFVLWLEDWMIFFLMIALALGLARRYTNSVRMEGSKGLRRDAIIIIYAVAIHATFSVLLEASELASGAHPWITDRGHSLESSAMGPTFALAIARWFVAQGFNLTVLENILWWGHSLSVFLFLIYIFGTQIRVPQFYPSKHFHIVSAPFNVFFRNLKPSGRLVPLDFEDESIEEYGISKVEDFTWKQMLDLYSCTGCGRCQEVCPAYINGQPLSPKSLILDLRENLLEVATFAHERPGEEIHYKHLAGEVIPKETLWACTTCNACQTACPLFIEHIDKIIDMRREQAMMQSEFPSGIDKMFTNVERNSNPWGISKSDRDLWAEGLGVKTMKENPDADLLFWVGCAGSFDERAKKVSTALVKILQAAGIDFAILGKEEKCTGDPVRRLGNEFLAQELITENVQLLNSYEVKEIITFCPHCFNTLTNEFPDFGGVYRVYHATDYIAKLLRNGKLPLKKGDPVKLTYHDSCYLGRHNGIYSSPREILDFLDGVEFVEMAMNKDVAMCCGAGGGRMWFEQDAGGEQINRTRVAMAAETGADYIGVSCPFCTAMLEDGIKNTGAELKVVDLLELVVSRLETD